MELNILVEGDNRVQRITATRNNVREQ